MRSAIFSIVILIGGLFVTLGCEDEELSIVGVYTLTREKVTSCTDPVNNKDQAKICTATDCETLTIGADGTFSLVEIDGSVTTTVSGNYVISGNTIAFTEAGSSSADVATYILSESQLVLSFEQDPDGCADIDTYTRK